MTRDVLAVISTGKVQSPFIFACLQQVQSESVCPWQWRQQPNIIRSPPTGPLTTLVSVLCVSLTSVISLHLDTWPVIILSNMKKYSLLKISNTSGL